MGAVLAILANRIAAPNRKPLIPLLNALMGMIVLPYQGTAAAERELRAPKQKPRITNPPPRVDPLRDLECASRTGRCGCCSRSGNWSAHPPRAPRERAGRVRSRRPGPQQPPGGGCRRHRGPGPDLKAARAPAEPRPDREHGWGPRQRRAERLASHRQGAERDQDATRGGLREPWAGSPLLPGDAVWL